MWEEGEDGRGNDERKIRRVTGNKTGMEGNRVYSDFPSVS